MTLKAYLHQHFNISYEFIDFCLKAEQEVLKLFKEIDNVAEINQFKVLKAMQKNKLSDSHFAGTTGYGYNDLGRETTEKIFADVFNAEDALVRPQLISGTHALTVALFGNLSYGDEMLSVTSKPYDTLDKVIGIKKTKGSLLEHGVSYNQVDFLPNGYVDFEGIKKAIKNKTKLVAIQRSKGYSLRRSLSIDEIKQIVSTVKAIDENIICMVDNCYGEFTETLEPCDVGADLSVGSLIKNAGGGLAPVGGYIIGKREFVENAAYRLTSPGLGKEVGPMLNVAPSFLQGLFLAPQVVANSLKCAVFAAKVFENLGYEVYPKSNEKRSDIVQAIKLENAENVLAFCRGIQNAAPVDSFVKAEAAEMPGYDCPVVMAAGAFVQGSSIELSADAPVREPYAVYLQGGLTWFHAKIGVIVAASKLNLLP